MQSIVKKWGYIDDSGELQYPAVYTRATIFNENRAWVVRPDEAPCAIDTKGRLQLTLTRASKVMIFCEGMAAFAKKRKKENDGDLSTNREHPLLNRSIKM